jgi:hypothetical protein
MIRHMLNIGWRSLARFVELEGFDRSMALAGQAFAALLPLLNVIDRFDLSGSAADTLRMSLAQPPDTGIGVRSHRDSRAPPTR